MSDKFLRVLVALAALLASACGQLNIQPQYQVSIMWAFHPENPVHMCNGIIISDRLVMTTADCVHIKFGPKDKAIRLDASDLSVVAGSTNAFIDALQINVSSIKVADNFNRETLENDLAVLKLSKPLPLGTRPDMKWIMLDDNNYMNDSCLVNFFSRNSKTALPNYYQTEKLSLYDNQVCRNSTKYPNVRKDDICSIYVLPQQFDCVAADKFLAFNNDRGSGLVCKSYLVGLLSSVVTRPDPKNNCTDVTLVAMYTNICPHLMWIYSIMFETDTEYTSTPYDASTNMLVTNNSDNNEHEVLTSTVLPTTVAVLPTAGGVLNSTAGNLTANSLGGGASTITNSTNWNSTATNWNSTATNWNSTATKWNSTATNTTGSKPVNSTAWIHERLNVTALNTTTTAAPPYTPPHSYITRAPAPTPVPVTSSTNSYFKYPVPTIRNFFGNSAAPRTFSAGGLLIASVTLRLIIYH